MLGFGAIGSRIVDTARTLGLRLRVVCRNPRSIPGVEHVTSPREMPDALAASDYVIVCLPLTRATRHLLDERALASLPPHASLIDVSRGGVLDPVALDAALRSGRLRSAALDVFEEEPLPERSPLWSCPRLLITPHVGGFTPDYLERALDVFLENVELLRSGKPPRTPVSREHEY